jgi:hypothetical protein
MKLRDFPAHLASLTPADWKPLLDLIPEIEKTTIFEVEDDRTVFQDGDRIIYPCSEIELVSSFRDAAYATGIVIDFDWPGWDEGRKLASGSLEAIDKLDLITLCKLVTAIIRNDRFCDGELVSCFESGLMQRVLRAIRKIVQNS